MSGLWDQPGIPQRGWTCTEIDDVEDNYERCEMCGNEKVRFVHVVEHPQGITLRVGCVCAEKMSEDYTGPQLRERGMRQRSARREKWLERKWRVSAKGNEYLRAKGHHVVVFLKGKRWGALVDGATSPNSWPSSDRAKLAAFDHLWPRKQPVSTA